MHYQIKIITNDLLELNNILICVGVIYFILRIIYGISHIEIFNYASLIFSMVTAVGMFIIAIISFLYEKKRKDAIQSLGIFIILAIVNIIDYLL